MYCTVLYVGLVFILLPNQLVDPGQYSRKQDSTVQDSTVSHSLCGPYKHTEVHTVQYTPVTPVTA